MLTSSIFCEPRLRDGGFPAECARNESDFHRVVAVKTFYPAFLSNTFESIGMPQPTAAIVVVRAPLDAILAYHAVVAPKLDKEHDESEFDRFFVRSVRQWMRHMSILNSRHPMGKKAGPDVPVLFLYYEDLLRDPPGTLLRVFKFLKENPLEIEELPSAEEAVVCALRRSRAQVLKKRSRVENAPAVTPAQIARLCAKTSVYWNEEKWGNCLDGVQNKTKTTSIQATLPTELCPAVV